MLAGERPAESGSDRFGFGRRSAKGIEVGGGVASPRHLIRVVAHHLQQVARGCFGSRAGREPGGDPAYGVHGCIADGRVGIAGGQEAKAVERGWVRQ